MKSSRSTSMHASVSNCFSVDSAAQLGSFCGFGIPVSALAVVLANSSSGWEGAS